MTEEVHSRPLPPSGAPVAAAADPTLMNRVDGVLEGLWRLLSSMRMAMIIMLVIAALGVIGSLVIQAPTAVMDDPAAKANWLAEVRPKFAGWTNVMDTLQVFQIFNSIYFRILVAALTISLIACSVHRIPGIWRTATKPRIDVGPQFFEHAQQREAIVVRCTATETQAIVEGVLRARRYRTQVMGDGIVSLYADRFRWVPIAGLVGHLSLVVILIGGIAGTIFGYRDSGFTIAEGQTRAIAAEQGLSIELLDFTDRYDPVSGSPIDYASQIVVFKDGAEIDRHTVRVNDPYRYGSTSVYQAFFGAAAVVTVKDAAGTTLLEEGVPLAWRTTADNRPVGSLTVPGVNNVIWLVGTLGSGDKLIKPGQIQVELYTPGEASRIAADVIDQGVATQFGDLTITFERESSFTGLSVARDPGVMLVWLGSALLCIGFVIRFTVPHKRVWARIVGRPNGGAVLAMAGLGTRNVAGADDFDNLVNDMRVALLAPTQT